MFRLTRLPLRRCLHTAAGAAKAPRYRLGLTVGLSAAALGFSVPTLALDSSSSSTAAPVSSPPTTSALSEIPVETTEEDTKNQGAYNPETGEINWDCPCLGGMAHGPCGEEFKAAFSCFVHSNDEPKGINCVEKFQGMQECFRQHPEVYAAELMDDDEEASAPVQTGDTPTPTPEPESASLVAKGRSTQPKAKSGAPAPSTQAT